MPRKHYQWEVGELPPEIGQHSLAKHRVFDRYVQRYIEILAARIFQRQLNLTIVDGFCGGGAYRHGRETVPGSPLILLKAVKTAEVGMRLQRKNGFDVKADFFFIDEQTRHCEFLIEEMKKSEFASDLGRTIRVEAAQFEEVAPRLIEFIKQKGSAHRSLFFLDQYGWSAVSFQTIRGIFASLKNPEVLLTFSVDSLIDYLTEQSAQTSSAEAIGLTPELIYLLTKLRDEQAARHIIQNVLYKHIISNTGARFYTPFFIRSADNHRALWLLHLSTQERARDEMARLHWEVQNTFAHYGGAGFNALGFDASIDLSQITLFDFGQQAQELSRKAAIEQLPKLIYADAGQDGEPVSIRHLFGARCNDTPLTKPLIDDAITELRSLGEIEVVSSDGKIKPRTTVYAWEDLVRRKPQRSFMRVLTVQ